MINNGHEKANLANVAQAVFVYNFSPSLYFLVTEVTFPEHITDKMSLL